MSPEVRLHEGVGDEKRIVGGNAGRLVAGGGEGAQRLALRGREAHQLAMRRHGYAAAAGGVPVVISTASHMGPP